MLKSLEIKNVALIDAATIDFSEGLNVLSGETGSGKSVILESLHFVLGAKADKTLIRSGENECLVKAVFYIENLDAFNDVFEEIDIEADETVIISRKLNIDGKGSVKINGNVVNISMLKKLTSKLIENHAQSEHFFLLKPSNQLSLLDKIGEADILPVKETIKEKYGEYKEVLKSLKNLGGSENERQIRLDILNFQINEITSFDLKEDEEEKLTAIRQKLINLKKINDALSSLSESLEGEGGAIDILSNSEKILNSITSFGEEYRSLSDRLNSVIYELNDLSSEAERFLDDDAETLNPDEIEDRLVGIKSLKRKYGNGYTEICEYLEKVEKERDALINFSKTNAVLLDKKAALEKVLYKEYVNLNALRKKHANSFEKNIIEELKELAINGDFKVHFEELPNIENCQFSSDGIDKINFLFTANLGEPLKDLSSVISGGEMSRFMLAVKTHVSAYNQISTFVFDEIDAGISGRTAKIVAEKFAKIAKNTQVIAVSHLPQISAMADSNFLIEKAEEGGKTYTHVKPLDNKEKIFEVIRLIGGEKLSESATVHAKNLISEAENYKKSI